MTFKHKLIKLLEHPNIVFAKLWGVHPLYAEYIESIKEIINKSFNTIIDVGANNGWYSEAAHYYYPNAEIYAFEPVPSKAKKLNSLSLSLFISSWTMG